MRETLDRSINKSLKQVCGGLEVEPLLVGQRNKVHIAMPSATVRIPEYGVLAGRLVTRGECKGIKA